MRIQILVSVAGPDYAYKLGEIVDAPDEVAQSLLKAGHARKYTKKKQEAASLEGGEKAVAKKKTTRKKRA